MAFETAVNVRFGDVDRAGIVYYPRVLHYCHVAFEEFFERALGIPYPDLLEARKLGFPTVRLETSFERPFRYGHAVRANVRVAALGRTSVTFEYRFYDGASGQLLASSTNVTAAVDMTTFRPTPVPEDLRAALGRFTD